MAKEEGAKYLLLNVKTASSRELKALGVQPICHEDDFARVFLVDKLGSCP